LLVWAGLKKKTEAEPANSRLVGKTAIKGW